MNDCSFCKKYLSCIKMKTHPDHPGNFIFNGQQHKELVKEDEVAQRFFFARQTSRLIQDTLLWRVILSSEEIRFLLKSCNSS